MRRYTRYTKELLQDAASASLSVTGVGRYLGLKTSGGTHQFIKSKLKFFKIDTSHFTGQLWSKGRSLGEDYFKIGIPLDEVLVENSSYSSNRLKHRLFRRKIKEKKCEKCGITAWDNKVLPLELHHVNGDHNDNRLENLQILCPNCHSVVDKPIASAPTKPKIKRVAPDKILISDFVPNWRKRDRVEKRKVVRPSKDELVSLVSKLPFTTIAAKYGVSDNAVRKWCIRYELPYKRILHQ